MLARSRSRHGHDRAGAQETRRRAEASAGAVPLPRTRGDAYTGRWLEVSATALMRETIDRDREGDALSTGCAAQSTDTYVRL